MRYLKKNLLGIAGVLQCFFLFPQQQTNSVVDRLEQQSVTKPSELIYMQTNKDVYETGEDLWYKAYQLDAQSFELSGLSQTLYLQLISADDSIVWQEKYPIANGIADGHVYLDEKLSEGDYSLEAYTQHSFYDDTTGILQARKIRIVNSISRFRSELNNMKPEKEGFRFEMFPEGGNLVAGLPSRVAFKATDGKGNPVEVEGVLFQDEAPIAELKSLHQGMGACLFTPLSGKNYRVELSNGEHYLLPEIYPHGIVLRLSKQNKESLEFIISQSKGLPPQQIYLTGQVRGMVCCMAQGILRDNLKITIPLSEFPYQGIAEFTLYNEQLQPLAERLVYVHPGKNSQSLPCLINKVS